MNDEKIVFAKCRRGSDLVTKDQSCDSTSVEKLSPDGSNQPSFKCKKCGYSWSVAIGGGFVIQ